MILWTILWCTPRTPESLHIYRARWHSSMSSVSSAAMLEDEIGFGSGGRNAALHLCRGQKICGLRFQDSGVPKDAHHQLGKNLQSIACGCDAGSGCKTAAAAAAGGVCTGAEGPGACPGKT